MSIADLAQWLGAFSFSQMRHRMEEELSMMELFVVRLHTREFISWTRRDGVL